jgi:microcin C transport system substrate-binding protein
VFTEAYMPPRTDGSGNNRANLIEAGRLLKEAGWRIVEGRLVDRRGRKLRIEFLIAQASFQRIIGPYRKNLKRLGIDTRLRIVDAANFQQRLQQFDFDITMRRYGQAMTPGSELRGFYGAATADVPGTRNVGGIRNPAVDVLIEHVIAADTRAALTAAARALDRVLMWNQYLIPHWYKGAHNIAYWNKFGRPEKKADYDLGLVDTWWVDAAKAAHLEAGDVPTPEGTAR